MAIRTDEEWEQLALGWRRAADMDGFARFDPVAFVKWLKHSKHIRDYITVPASKLPNAEGKYEPDEQRIYYRDTTVELAKLGNPHARWTVLHEACHFILEHKGTRLRSSAQISQRFYTRQENRDETDTNRLTACIFAPFDKTNYSPNSTVEDLMERFGLSRVAATRRLDELGRLYRLRHGIKRPLPPGVIDFLQAQKNKGFHVSSLCNDFAKPSKLDYRYEGEACPCCNEYKLTRIGLRMQCDACGAQTGED